MKITRDKLRGKKLEKFCKMAKTTIDGECVVCYGLTENCIEGTRENVLKECVNCKAFVLNLESPKAGSIEE